MSGPSRIRLAAGRLAERPRALGVAAAAILGVITLIIIMSVNGVPFQKRHTLRMPLPADAPPVDVADQVRIGGQRAGIVSTAAPKGDRSELTLRVDPRFWPLPEETTARVRVKPASGLVYIELTPRGSGEMAEDATIDSSRVSAATTLPEAAEAFDQATRSALSESIRTTGGGLIGQEDALRSLGSDTAAVLRDGTPLVDSLTPAEGVLAGLVSDAQTVGRALSGSGRLPAGIAAGAEIAAQFAAGREDLGAALDSAPGLATRVERTTPQVEELLATTESLIDDLDPLTSDMLAQLPQARRLLSSSRSLRSSTVKLTAAADEALAEAPAAFRALRGPTLLTSPASAAVTPITDTLTAYRSDLLAGVRGLEAVTSKPYPEGATAPGAAALRFAPVLGCHSARNPFPAPGQAIKDQAKRGEC